MALTVRVEEIRNGNQVADDGEARGLLVVGAGVVWHEPKRAIVGVAALVSAGGVVVVPPAFPLPQPQINALAKTKAANISDLIRT